MPADDVAQLLSSMRAGDRRALDALVPLLYDELRHIARRQRGGGSGETLRTTALVHEAYLRLAERSRLRFASEDHFLAASATVMRHILVDRARMRLAEKRGGGATPVTLSGVADPIVEQAEGLLALDEALDRLAAMSPRLAEVVELRFFAGFGVDETARLLARDARTIKRDWQKARLLLAGLLAPEGAA
jgi:RNA polymerase sigma factor (TIGR02999 family)